MTIPQASHYNACYKILTFFLLNNTAPFGLGFAYFIN